MPTFHPAFLLRSPDRKKDVWEDMKLVRDYLAAPGIAGSKDQRAAFRPPAEIWRTEERTPAILPAC